MSRGRLLSKGGAALALLGPACAFARAFYDFQTPVTPIGRDVLFIHDLFLVIIAALFLGGTGTLLYSVYAHRYRLNRKPASFTGPVGAKQWIWAGIPFAALLFLDYVILGIPALHSILALADMSGSALTIKVTGRQWNWQYEYPTYGIRFTSTLSTPQDQIANRAPKDEHFLLEVDRPLVLPTHEKVRIILASADVIHAFWVPSFGIKQDAVPGYLRQTWVEIDKPGTYRGQCAELCGVGHAFMPIVVVAKSPQDFNRWVGREHADEAAQQAASSATYTRDELVAAGKKVFDTNCAACHQPNGLGIPGAFPPIAGGHAFAAAAPMISALESRGFYKNGDIVVGPVADHIRIVLQGIPGTPMPSFASQLSPADIAAVVTYERNEFGNHTGDAVEPAQVAAMKAGH